MSLELLSIEEAELLAQLECDVRDGLKAVVAVEDALQMINEGKLYRASHRTFEDYCKDRWKLDRKTAYRYIAASKVRSHLSPIGDRIDLSKLPESVLRPLAPLSPSDCERVMTKVIEGANSGQRVTAKMVREKVQAFSAKNTIVPEIAPCEESEGDPEEPEAVTAVEVANPFAALLKSLDNALNTDAFDRAAMAQLFIDHIRKKCPECMSTSYAIDLLDSLPDKDLVSAVEIIQEQRSELFAGAESEAECSPELSSVFPGTKPVTPADAVDACERIRESLPKGKREFDALMHKKWYGRAELSPKVKPDTYLPALPKTGQCLLSLIYEMRFRKDEILGLDSKVFRNVVHKKLALDLIEATHRAAEELRRFIDPSESQPTFDFLPDVLDTKEFQEAWTIRKKMLRDRGSNMPSDWEQKTLAKLEAVGHVKALASVQDANMRNGVKMMYVDYEPKDFGPKKGASKGDDGSNGFGPSFKSDKELVRLVKADILEMPSRYHEHDGFMLARAVERERLGLPDDRHKLNSVR
jgi:hypothetical protein